MNAPSAICIIRKGYGWKSVRNGAKRLIAVILKLLPMPRKTKGVKEFTAKDQNQFACLPQVGIFLNTHRRIDGNKMGIIG